MGKTKDQKSEVMNAFYRMNYLYQASVIASRILPETVLANYYGRLMKEISKKVVEKLHPNVKRTLCSCCSYPLFTNNTHVNIKIKSFRKNKTKKKIRKKTFSRNNNGTKINQISLSKSSDTENSMVERYFLKHMNKKNFRPNKIYWDCKKCGFSRKFILRPTHDLWVDKYDFNAEL